MASGLEKLNEAAQAEWQLPGEFVVDTRDILHLTYRYNYCEDFPDHRVLLTAIREEADASTKSTFLCFNGNLLFIRSAAFTRPTDTRIEIPGMSTRKCRISS